MQQVSVQGLWYFVQPPLASLGLSAAIASEATSRELRGAPLLNMLHAKAASVSGQSPLLPNTKSCQCMHCGSAVRVPLLSQIHAVDSAGRHQEWGS